MSDHPDDVVPLSHEKRTEMLYRAVFGERNAQTLRRKAGLQDDMQLVKWLAILLAAHAFGLPTDKVGESVGKLIGALVTPSAVASPAHRLRTR